MDTAIQRRTENLAGVITAMVRDIIMEKHLVTEETVGGMLREAVERFNCNNWANDVERVRFVVDDQVKKTLGQAIDEILSKPELSNEEAKKPSKPSRGWKPWSKGEDSELVKDWYLAVGIIAKKHSRTPEEIASKIGQKMFGTEGRF